MPRCLMMLLDIGVIFVFWRTWSNYTSSVSALVDGCKEFVTDAYVIAELFLAHKDSKESEHVALALSGGRPCPSMMSMPAVLKPPRSSACSGWSVSHVFSLTVDFKGLYKSSRYLFDAGTYSGSNVVLLLFLRVHHLTRYTSYAQSQSFFFC